MSTRIAVIMLWLLVTLAVSAHAQTVEYLHTDALGSVVAVTNASRTVLERREYEPYGSQLTPAVTNGPGYTGHVQDAATGLVYMQQRYYDAQIGRFLSVDPVAAREKGDNFNRYAYAFNSPYRFKDPTGTEAECVVRNNCANVVLTEGQVKVAGTIAAFTAVGTVVDGVNAVRAAATGDPVAIAGAVLDVATKKIDAVADAGRAVKSALKGMNNPKTSDAVKAGQKAHKAYNPGESFKKEYRLPSGRRMDGYNPDTKEIKELKPDTPTGRAAGARQLNEYCAECNRELGDGHTTQLDTYNPADFQ